MVFVQVGPFTDNVSGRDEIRFPFYEGMWRVYFLGSSGQPRSIEDQIGDVRMNWFPNIGRVDNSISQVIQTESLEGRGNVQPNQLFGMTSGISGCNKHWASPWCMGDIDCSVSNTMKFTSGLITAGTYGARSYTLWFDCYRVG